MTELERLQSLVRNATLEHPHSWNELDHAQNLIENEGFDGEFVQSNMQTVMQTMLQARAETARG